MLLSEKVEIVWNFFVLALFKKKNLKYILIFIFGLFCWYNKEFLFYVCHLTLILNFVLGICKNVRETEAYLWNLPSCKDSNACILLLIIFLKKAKKAYGFIWFQYFQLDKVLDSQYLESEAAGNRVDEEHLFIIVHQGSQKSIREMYPLLSCLTTAELSTILDISHTHLCIQIE